MQKFDGFSRLIFRFFFVTLIGVKCACQAIAAETLEAFQAEYPKPVLELGGNLQEGEIASAFAITKAIRKGLEYRFAPAMIRRDAHPKAHGCVRARFDVELELEKRLAKGMFSPGASYPAWIRFSNGDSNPERADGEGDGRGMALKVIGVPRQPMFGDAHNQDFIMISHPTFLVNDGKDYLSLIKIVNSESRASQILSPLLVPWAIGLRGARIAAQTTSKKIANPLTARYWSMVPYRLGIGADSLAIKFSARPCSTVSNHLPKDPGPNFLREAMVATLANGDACMEFLIQPRNPETMSIEESQIEWDENEAPFIRVATITIPRQAFATREQDDFCENLSFNPWRAMPEHRPLGAVNRMRKVIYKSISEFRRKTNNVPTSEPVHASNK